MRMFEVPQCACMNKKLGYIVNSIGGKMYTMECQDCGTKGTWIKASSLSKADLDGAHEIDGTIREGWEEKRGEIFKEFLEEKKRENKGRIDEAKAEYAEYLLSSVWRDKRERRLAINRKIHDGLCEVCGNRPATQCHHITYARIRKEWMFDLACVCRRCHENLHDIRRDAE